jgi:hypothetical protein
MGGRYLLLPFTAALIAHFSVTCSKDQSQFARRKKAMQVLKHSTIALESFWKDRDVSQGIHWKLDIGGARRPLSLTSLAGPPPPVRNFARSGAGI